MIAVSDVLRRASVILNDEDFVRWTRGELIDWLNDAAAEVVIRRPPAYIVNSGFQTTEGPFQQLPEGAIQLIDVTNCGSRGVSRIARKLLDDQYPSWRAEPLTDRIRHFMYEETSPTTFRVYPPAKAGVSLGVIYYATPPKVSSESDTLDMDRVYLSPLVSFVLYRALAKDSEFANGQLAAAHLQAFSEAVGTRNEVATAVSPNQAAS